MKRRLALIGSKGMLAAAVYGCAGAEWDVTLLDLPEFDLTDPVLVASVLGTLSPEVIVNCAAYTNVDGAESEEALAMRVNGDGPGYLANVARQLGAILVHISTDYVFDGRKRRPYREEDPVAPLSAYGRSKLAGEQAIVASGLQRYFIIRTSWLYGPGGKNFVETMLRLASERDELRVVADQVGTPTYTGDLARAIYRLLGIADRPGSFGIYNFSNLGECSWHGFAEEIVALAKAAGLPIKTSLVTPIRTDDYPLPAIRPGYSVFSKEKYLAATGVMIPHWQESLKLYFQERRFQ